MCKSGHRLTTWFDASARICSSLSARTHVDGYRITTAKNGTLVNQYCLTSALFLVIFSSNLAFASEKLGNAEHYSKDGADTCLQCHDQTSNFPVMAIFNSAHGSKDSKNAPFSTTALQCETCHGAVGEHAVKRLRKSESRAPMIAFNAQDNIASEEKSAICLACHQKSAATHWQGSSHQVNNLTCNDCHQIHVSEDPILTKSNQLEQCGQCHKSAKLTAHRASTHPLRSGQMGCSDCHQPHDSNSDKLLIADTVNETCFQCHAEKRGPFLWEHEPVTDSCLNCHQAHGSNQANLLTQRAPYLCQNCHSSQGHPSFSFGSSNLPQQSPSAFLLGRSCNNCHSKVHGSNHPSGSQLQR